MSKDDGLSLGPDDLMSIIKGEFAGSIGPSINHVEPDELPLLTEIGNAAIGPNPYKAGDFVTPREFMMKHGIGRPHIVIESRVEGDEIINDHITDPSDASSTGFASKLNIRALCLADSNHGKIVVPFWMEHWMVKPWEEEK